MQPMPKTTKRPKLGSSTGHELPSLSQELILEILFWVPVKSLLRFRCVCKSWKTLISNPKFAKDHLRNSHADPKMTHQRLLSSILRDTGVISFSLHALFRNPSIPFNKARCFKMNDKYFILGSCNGLLCLHDIRYPYVLLWNPAIKFTSTRFPTNVNPNLSLTLCGFGYDHVNDKYKLLIAEEDFHHLIVTKVFTFAENFWKVIQNSPFHRPIEWYGKFVSGTLNWLTTTERSVVSDQKVILSFDVSTETFGVVLLPPEGERDSGEIINLVTSVLRDCLSICFYDYKEACWVVWLMKEYGVRDSWTKFMTIPHFIQDTPIPRLPMPHHFQQGVLHGICTFRRHHSLNLVSISENGVVVLKTNFSKMVLYNSKNGRLYYPKIRGDNRLHHLHTYHESLVVPL